ncbi:MAG: STAS domain-containing protein [Reichenbachiella sp.]|uniref:STAS domain-containing protein n=1 Tax=Reichenbachiella sp. TaxID=2184521 RepID=UPI0032671C51
MIKIDNHINDEPEYYQLSVGGEIDASSSIHLEEGLKNAMQASKKIIVDLAELEYISSAGLGVFMSIIQELDNQNIKFIIYGMAPKVYEVFEILGLNQLISIKKDKEEALEAIK